MRFRPVLTALALIAPMAVAAGPALGNVLISIDKSTQRMTVSVDGARRYSWPVSTGTPDRATPAGSFQPFRLEEQHFSKEWDDAPMPHSIFFTKAGHAIHGSEAVRRLGTPASHGCVRISPPNAAKLFALVQSEGLPKTRVVITGSEPEPAPPQVAETGDAQEGTATARPERGRADAPLPGAEPRRSAEQNPEAPGTAPARGARKRGWSDEGGGRSVFADSFYDEGVDEYRAYPPDMEDHAYAPYGEDPDNPPIQIYPDEGQIDPGEAEPGWD
jgi:hypothetical protein